MYTVRQLSKIAGITPRALHYYDEIGLLKPSRVGDNGYRYYGEEALLRLQQIMLYRELDLPLDEIKKIVDRNDFDLSSALVSHREELRKRIARLERLVITVDLTLSHIIENKEMTKNQLFEAFSEELQVGYENEAIQLYDSSIVRAANSKWKQMSTGEKKQVGDEGNAIYEAFLKSVPKGAASPEAQTGVERWRRHIEIFWTPTDEQLLGLADLYLNDPRFKVNFDRFDPRLAEFIRSAVKVYLSRRKSGGDRIIFD